MGRRCFSILLATVLVAAAPLLQPPSAAGELFTPTASRPMLLLKEADNGKSVDLRVGEAFAIELPENATTGYRWEVDHRDEALIEAVANEAHYSGKAVGSGGEVTFVFKGIRVGSGEISLKQWRRWEGDSSVVGRFRLRVNVVP